MEDRIFNYHFETMPYSRYKEAVEISASKRKKQ